LSWRKDLWEEIDAALLWLAMEPAGKLDRWLHDRKIREMKREQEESSWVTYKLTAQEFKEALGITDREPIVVVHVSHRTVEIKIKKEEK
jgi:regulator of PEP synthase PpsR (kinase-PPPase family)